MMNHPMKFALVLALALGGCSKEEPNTEPVPAAQPARPAEPSPELAPEDPTTQTPAVAAPEDFEDEAARTVQLENLDAELDRLEAEIE
jgi:hypothetical protein